MVPSNISVSLFVYYIEAKKEGRLISLFVMDNEKMNFPAGPESRATMASMKGYNAACWIKGGMGYIAVSDLDQKSLESLAQKLRAKG